MTAQSPHVIESKPTNAIMAFAAFCGLSLLTIVPILRNAYLPLVDLPNHIARHYLATAPAGPLDRYYEYTLGLVPNSAVDFAWILLGSGLDPVDFSRYAMAFYCVALIASTMLLSRVLYGRWSVWSGAAALVCYNACFFWGFQNFIVSVPFAILSLTFWLWSERLSIWRRIVLLAPIALLLYLLHFFAFAILAVAVLGRELQRIYEAGAGWKRMFVQAVLLAIPFVVPMAWLLFDVLTGPASPAGSFTTFGGVSQRIEVLQSVVLGTGHDLPSAIRVTGLAIFLLLTVVVCAAFSKSVLGGLTVAPQMRGPLIMLALFALVIPYWLNGVGWVHIRFPFVVVALFLASTQWSSLSSRHATIMGIAVVLLLAGRGIAFDRYASEHARQVENFIALIEDVPAGERLVGATMGREIADKQYRHVGAYAVVYGDVFIPTLFQGVHALQVKPEWADYATAAYFAVPMSMLLRDWETDPLTAQFEFLRNWDQKYTYLMLLDSPSRVYEPVPQLDPIATQGRFTLFKVAAPQ